MRRHTWRHRALSTALLVLSIAVALVLPMADAYAERQTVAAAPHVEEPGSTNCAPAHDELACQICRGLRLTAVGAPAVESHEPARRVARAASRTTAFNFSPSLAGSSSPRAPPAA